MWQVIDSGSVNSNSGWVVGAYLVYDTEVAKEDDAIDYSHLALEFRGGHTEVYLFTNRWDYEEACSAPSAGELVHAKYYGRGISINL